MNIQTTVPENGQRAHDGLAMVIGGKLRQINNSFDVLDPATGQAFASAPEASQQDLDDAVAAAEAAFPAWAAMPWSDRRALVLKFCDAVAAEADDIGALVAQEAGKPLAKGIGETNGGLFFVRGFANLELKSEVLRDTDNQYVRVEKRPIGVVGAITAWNYPALLALWKIGPALLTGNTLILKPAPSTPLTALRLGKIAKNIFPAGVINVLTGGDDLGRWMTAHDRIGKIAFTGSVDTGKAIMANAAPTLKRLTLELGGNDAAIIMPDFDINTQAEELFWAGFANNGQVCACMKRAYVPSELYEALCSRLAAIAANVKMGPWNEPDVELGPLQNRQQLDIVTELVEDAISRGANAFFKGDVPQSPGFYHPVTLFRDVPDEARIVREEQFGPALAFLKYHDLQDAITRANDTLYGLAGSVWGRNIDAATAVAVRLQAGNVFVNQHPSMGPEIPYGGIRQSGLGVECGVQGLSEYTNTVVVNIKKD
ncbi:MAG: aldehyde dehydrogenase family protein [Rhodospirillaceae bacterium]|nr:aldehyde dehydrogenase family protein [Rhodospirillaceae bacterium]